MSENYVKSYESVIQEIQFCIQDVIHLVIAPLNPPNPNQTDMDDELQENENKYFAFQQQSFIGTKAFHGKEISEKLQQLIELIKYSR